MRRRSTLPAETERVIAEAIGAAIFVHRTLGPGFLESIYRRALCIELSTRGIRFETERGIAVVYRGVPIPGQRIDLVVEDCVLIELKCVDAFVPIHTQQIISYLKTTGLRAGLLMNFNVSTLRDGLKRIVL